MIIRKLIFGVLVIFLLCSGTADLAENLAFRRPAALMVNFLNRTQQIVYAIAVSDWKMLQKEARGLKADIDSYISLAPRNTPMANQLREFRKDVQELIEAAKKRDGMEIGKRLGKIEFRCIQCHKLYRDF